MARVGDLVDGRETPVLVGIDGGGGAGKSTLAAAVVAETAGVSVIEGDDFYVGFRAEDWDAMTLSEQADHCIDWRRQRLVLETLAQGRDACWQRYDWDADNGRLAERWCRCDPTWVVLLEGVYSTRPELADLLDLKVLVDAPDDVRRERIRAREGDGYREEWEARWFAAESYYLEHVLPPDAFDLVLR